MEKINFDRCSYINVNEVKNININETHKTKKSLQTVRVTVDRLLDKLGNEANIAFYRKVAWHLPEHKIWSNLEIALTGQHPQKYFTFLCKMDLGR